MQPTIVVGILKGFITGLSFEALIHPLHTMIQQAPDS
jgi:hypothetical protein